MKRKVWILNNEEWGIIEKLQEKSDQLYHKINDLPSDYKKDILEKDEWLKIFILFSELLDQVVMDHGDGYDSYRMQIERLLDRISVMEDGDSMILRRTDDSFHAQCYTKKDTAMEAVDSEEKNYGIYHELKESLK